MRKNQRFVQWRIGLFAVGAAVVAGSAFADPQRGGWIPLGVFGAVFLAVAYAHSRLKTRLRRLDRWIDMKRTHLARIRIDWANIPDPGHLPPEDHPFAIDLDITGPKSLLRWLDTTVSTVGQATLRRWLLAPSRHDFASRRQLIRDLTPLSLFRDRILLAAAGSSRLNGERVIAAIGRGSPPRLRAVLLLETLLAALTASLVSITVLHGAPNYWILSLVAYGAIWWLASPHVSVAFSQAMEMEADLAPYSRIFAILEQRAKRAPGELQVALARFRSSSPRPSEATQTLAGLVAALNLRANPLIHVAVNALLPWDLFFADRYRILHRQLADRFPEWVAALGRIEAASALAHYAATQQPNAYPELRVEGATSDETYFSVESVAHPLLPSATRVGNSFELQGRGAVAIITGSNMSGKSTFLRTLGVNICLAKSGAPVCARRWTSPWFRLFCCIRVDDSLDAGLSYFYAEVKRLKRLLDAAESSDDAPLFFLIDEIFRGTNNRERLIGSRHYVMALSRANAIGLVSTHDLELAALQDGSDRISCHHFRESVAAEGLTFDYRLRPGPCPTTNALTIMAREGLPVPNPDVDA